MSNEEKTTIGFRYGVIQPTLDKQASEQGYTLENYERFEKIRVSVNVLSLNNFITESQVGKILNKLHKEVVKNLTKDTEK